MSHESYEPGRGVVYTLPAPFSDIIRTREFNKFFRKYQGATFSVRTLDGWSWSSWHGNAPQFIASFKTREALDAVIDNGSETSLGHLFLDGGIELDGNVLVLLSIAQFTLQHSDGLSRGLIQTITSLTHHFARKLIPTHRITAQQSWHYSPCPLDLPVSFFEPWLGSSLGHSCSWLETETDEFDSAQQTALERACEWLEIEKGDQLLDVGCGWGSLLLHAAKAHGANVQGITASDLQAATAVERIHQFGLQHQCTVVHRDLRQQSGQLGEFEKIAHLGIFEHVGNAELATFLRYIHGLLAPGGLLLLHRMTKSTGAGACITSLPSDLLSGGISHEMELAERAGFDLIRVESIRKAYERTLRIWIDRLLNAKQDATTHLFSTGYRAWMLYLIEVLTCLNAGEAQVHRVLLRRRA